MGDILRLLMNSLQMRSVKVVSYINGDACINIFSISSDVEVDDCRQKIKHDPSRESSTYVTDESRDQF